MVYPEEIDNGGKKEKGKYTFSDCSTESLNYFPLKATSLLWHFLKFIKCLKKH